MFSMSIINLSALCSSYAKIVCCSSELIFMFLYVGSRSKIRARNSSCVSTFRLLTLLFIQPHEPKCNTGLEIQAALFQLPFRIRHMFVWTFFFFYIMTNSVTFQNTNLSSWMTLYTVMCAGIVTLNPREKLESNLMLCCWRLSYWCCQSFQSPGIWHHVRCVHP